MTDDKLQLFNGIFGTLPVYKCSAMDRSIVGTGRPNMHIDC